MFELPLLAYGYGQAAIGGWHCLAVDEDGRAYAWGKCHYWTNSLPGRYQNMYCGDRQQQHYQRGGDHKEVSTTCNANADWFEYAGGNEYGQCAKELDRKGHDKVLHRDISIPQRCCPRLRVRQVFPPSFCNGYATLVLS